MLGSISTFHTRNSFSPSAEQHKSATKMVEQTSSQSDDDLLSKEDSEISVKATMSDESTPQMKKEEDFQQVIADCIINGSPKLRKYVDDKLKETTQITQQIVDEVEAVHAWEVEVSKSYAQNVSTEGLA